MSSSSGHSSGHSSTAGAGADLALAFPFALAFGAEVALAASFKALRCSAAMPGQKIG